MKLPAKTIAATLARFGLVYLLLSLPWPGWKESCATYLRGLAGWALIPTQGPAEITIVPFSTRPQGTGDTRIVIVNRELMSRDGSGPERRLDLDLGRLGTATLAMLLALIVATPISWKRRAQATAFGLVLLHGLILGFLKYCVWAESAELSLVTLSSEARALAGGLKVTLIAQFSVTVPVLIWILVSFRREDRRLLAGPLGEEEHRAH